MKVNNFIPFEGSRRQFVGALAGSLWASRRARAWGAELKSLKSVSLCIFSKHLQWLDYKEMAQAAAELGFDGVDLTVRPRGHVLPERVQEDLPKAVEAVKSVGLQVPIMTTAIIDSEDPTTEAILKTASGLGIRYYRMGYYRYDENMAIEETLKSVKDQMRGVARLNEKYEITGDYQNHAGSTHLGAPLWDIWEVSRDLDPRWIGCQFDIRHATVEGASSWPVDFKLLSSRIHTLAMKDFKWEKMDQGWRVKNCPLGEGAVDFKNFFEMLTEIEFSGPISMHYEYPLGGANSGARELSIDKGEVFRFMRRDLTLLRQWLQEAQLV